MKKAFVMPLTFAVVVLVWVFLSGWSQSSQSTTSTSFPSTNSTSVAATSFENSGSVKSVGIGVYGDSNCTDRVSSIDWGVVEPGSTKNVTVYVRNEGNVAVSLQLNATNWSPVNASSFVGLSWDYDGKRVSSGEVVEVVLILSLTYKLDITEFSFDIIIIGRE